MSDQKISALLSFSLISTPMILSSNPSSPIQTNSVIAPVETSSRASLRRIKHFLSLPPKIEPKGTYVGELQERWQFPSDHLPIAMSFDGLNIVSWNVLDAEYINWVIEKNSQGLSRSQIADEHIYIGDSNLTVRDQHVVDLILQMISHPTHPRSLLALQECSEPFIAELKSRLPENFMVISHHGEAVVIDRNCFELIEAKEISGVFSEQPERTFQDITLRRIDNGEALRLVNVHLPGNPLMPGRFEWARYLADTFDPRVATIAMGDMNFNEIEMSDAMTQAFPTSPFSVHSPYCTNISPYTFISKAIDHFITYSPHGANVEKHAPDEVLEGLGSIVSLLEGTDGHLQKTEKKSFEAIAF
jgi:endonuclease/exonuclease/phosphatase family metal-dependent hydrolase